tara:strand:+ start:61264 stop:61698 length:435 start_codon:yes stop_codon:yes gene_type:complete
MKLGKKLEATAAQKALLLEQGEVLNGLNGVEYYYDETITSCFRARNSNGGSVPIQREWLFDWYYPAKTYTINGVELVDERVKIESILDYVGTGYFVSSIYQPIGWHKTTRERSDLNQYLCSISMVHYTKEAAIAHAKAMIKVTE